VHRGEGSSKEHRIAEPPGPEYAVKNQLQSVDAPIHSWYRFVLSYPPHLVREYLKTLEADPVRDWVLDPFCGTATTPVEARLQGFSSISVDANPISVLATRVKLSWDIDLDKARSRLDDVLELATVCLQRSGLSPVAEVDRQLGLFDAYIFKTTADDVGLAETGFDPDDLLPPRASALIPRGFISRKPLLRVLALRYAIEQVIIHQEIRDFMALGLANTIVKFAGNIGFGPEIYRRPPVEDADVLGGFVSIIKRMISDLQITRREQQQPSPPAIVFQDDARLLSSLENCPPIGIVITSPPYPNEKDYTRSTRLESVLLGFIKTKQDLRAIKSGLLRSNTRNVFARDDDGIYIKDIPSITRVADRIEEKRLQLGKTSGFERMYHRVTRLYFGGMYRHLAMLLPNLRPGARCAYVVGDQMSYFRIHIRTARLLADVAIKAGYEVEGIELWRTRRSTTTRQDLEENVLILRRPGSKGGRNA
jgi:DNA modification methylase